MSLIKELGLNTNNLSPLNKFVSFCEFEIELFVFKHDFIQNIGKRHGTSIWTVKEPWT